VGNAAILTHSTIVEPVLTAELLPVASIQPGQERQVRVVARNDDSPDDRVRVRGTPPPLCKLERSLEKLELHAVDPRRRAAHVVSAELSRLTTGCRMVGLPRPHSQGR